jgi:hypothetical protein
MKNEDVLDRFEKRGRAAGFLMGCGNERSQASAEQRISQALAIYHAHPHLQEKMQDIALSFTWSFIARLERDAYLRESTAQSGARLC